MKTAVISALFGAAVAASGAEHSCCSALAAHDALQGKVLGPDSDAYNARLKTYYSANAAQKAWCMVLPQSTVDVQALAQVISSHDCPFGIKAGAHSAWKGSNGIKDGVTVDLGYMNQTTYNPATNVVSIQPGSRWGPVYETLNQYNVTTVGARTSVVGVGGFTTGGGYSFHSNAHGLAADMVVNWEIVLANGTVVNANKDENADLWKAQKGGSGNLGFVTRIDQEAIPGTLLWGGFTQYDLKYTDAVFNAYLNFTEHTEPNTADQNIVALFYDKINGTGAYAIRSILTNADGIANRSVFDEYLSIPNLGSTLTVGPESEIIPQFTGPTPLGLYANWFTGMATNSIESLKSIDELHKRYVPLMEAAAPDATFNTLIEFQPVTDTMVANGNKRGGNIMGMEPLVEGGPSLMWLLSLTVDTEEHQNAILPIARQFIDAINDKQREQNTFLNWIYLNYAWEDEAPFKHYGQKNIKLLHDVSRKYDPRGVFQKLRQTGFKLAQPRCPKA